MHIPPSAGSADTRCGRSVYPLEIRAEGLVGDGFQIPFQLIESHRLKLHQAVKNDHLVLAGDQRQRVGKAGVLKIGVLNIVLNHLLSPKIVPVIIIST